ncbi:hypothetical protein FB45DRAFT_986776 [Roridomyces roridus]|uniref:FAD-binding PCMH-type domain-containing protein n=1 Tax=Roridomyces roridus TaxID=1738132 RepID=A0AAD7FZC9_9AGAR|nr:hypothetical protein FB45DRAFT_986776 [Roridomyces roridus]
MNALLIMVSFASLSLAATSPPSFSALNATISGRLQAATPFALPCFTKFNNITVEVDEEACAIVQANYLKPALRLDVFGANINPQWEGCQSTLSRCLLNPSNPQDVTAFEGASCNQGEIPQFYIDVSTPADVQAAFAFSAESNIPLSIKNTGHDYFGRTRREGSLGIWTHHLDSMTFNPHFTPESCTGTFRAITIGAGVTFDQVYNFADANNSTFVGGYAESIGASGGWLMGGGHSVLSPVYGLGVDRVLEFKIVTPDGVYRTANACQNPDLFWALRGGGGATFGVVIESTHLVEKTLSFQVATIAYNPAAAQAQEFWEIVVNNSLSWGEAGWGGHINSGGLTYVNPLVSLAEAKESFQQIAAFAVANGGTATFQTMKSWLPFYEQAVIPKEAPSGELVVLGSRLIPQTNFATPAGRAQLVQLMLNQTAAAGFPNIPVTTPVRFTFTEGATSVTPAWRGALWHLVTTALLSYNSTIQDLQATYTKVHDVVDMMRAVAPDSGSYFNEGEPYETNPPESYWGSENHARLLQIKQKYDPKHLLNCWNCVGSTDESTFPCYPGLTP